MAGSGTGKSVVLREIISWAKSAFRGKGSIAITAPTGIAAINIGGQSLHSWAGILLGKEDPQTLTQNIQAVKARYDRWKAVKLLIIDEGEARLRQS